ncbi:hypothetical protein SAY87_011551 [Trapa incisa]|uniref:Uncharacterized protein n=1 Tax=Trapa incisa TaxID=236973 RepID=A0AAN7JID8_9MYRT|nr:hypothetical protein SAY87_011551 [Trapa incisa]
MALEKKKTKDVGRGSGERRSNSPTKAEGEREPRLLQARCGEDTLENNKDTGGLSGCSLGDSGRVVTGSGGDEGKAVSLPRGGGRERGESRAADLSTSNETDNPVSFPFIGTSE